MDAKSNTQVIPRTLADLIREELLKDQLANNPPVSEINDYEVYPEDDGTDSKRNPYSRV